MRVHICGLFHTVCNDDYSHCAFTGKVRRFGKMMLPHGYDIIEYSNAGSESKVTEHVPMLSSEEFAKFYPPLGPTEQHARDAIKGSPGHLLFSRKLIAAMNDRVRPLDIVAHPFGFIHESLLNLFPEAIHVETGIGYNDGPFGCYRIFESEAWRHYHMGRFHWEKQADGKVGRMGPGMTLNYQWVIPNYFDLDEWPEGNGKGDYVLFMGRVEACKGIFTLKAIIEAWQREFPHSTMRFMVAGQGDFPAWFKTLDKEAARRVEYLGTVKGRARAKLVGEARCMVMPSDYIEPFGGAGVEGMLTGTPLVSSDYGAFTETITHGLTGYRCKTLGDWVQAIVQAPSLNRRIVAGEARERYSLEACAVKYDRAFRQLVELYHRGWNSLEAVNIPGA